MKTQHFLRKVATDTQALASAALSTTTTISRQFKLEEITIRASQDISETITITRDSASGSNYDVVLAKRNLLNERDFVFRPIGECNFMDGDEVKVECSNNNKVGSVYAEVKTSEM